MKKNSFLGSSIALFKSRKEVAFAVTWTTTLATLIAGRGVPPVVESFLSIMAMLMLSLSVYIYNDIVDREMDAFSNKDKKKGRPIAHGVVSENSAKIFVLITALFGFGLCYIINVNVLILGLVYYTLFYLYSYPKVRFKRIYIVKNIITALVLPVGFLIGGAAVENTVSFNMLFLSIAYFAFMFCTLPAGADCLDLEEDKAFKIKTIGGTLSWSQNILLFNFGMILMICSSIIAFSLLDLSLLSPALMVVLGVPVMIYTMRLSNENAITASYKLRYVGYPFLMLTPLIIALGVF